ncbi:MAG: PhnD/SsuA/transferrin family substrate-binding protein [Ignavibacteria bacterium]|nr:PhnD/SsuA/transferrin family substrate-binding protein [Ignavibacteria bacterium]
MINVLLILNLLFFGTTVTYCQHLKENGSENERDIKLVFAQNSFHDAKPEDVLATARVLVNHIKKLKNLKNNFIVELVSDDKEILAKHKSDFDLIVLSTEQYLRLKKTLPVEPFSVNYSDGVAGFIYHLIVSKNDNINNLAQLKGETIYIQANTKDQAASLWLNKLLKDESLKSKDVHFGSIIFDGKATNVLLPVFFNKAKACIVTNSSLKLILDLNPGIKNKIKTLYTSEPIILGIACLNSNEKDEVGYKVLKEILPTLHENEYGKQFLNLYKTEKLLPFKEEYLNGYFNLVKQ